MINPFSTQIYKLNPFTKHETRSRSTTKRTRYNNWNTWSSHLSTRPLASAGIMTREKGTFSFSADSMAWITLSALKVRHSMPSKHFFRWGCTRNGSLVSDKISSSSSLDRKKNLQHSTDKDDARKSARTLNPFKSLLWVKLNWTQPEPPRPTKFFGWRC